MIATVLAINQTCFSDAVVFLWRYFLSYLNELFLSVMCTLIPNQPPEKSKQKNANS